MASRRSGLHRDGRPCRARAVRHRCTLQLAIVEQDGGARITARILERAQIGERVRFVEERNGVVVLPEIEKGSHDSRSFFCLVYRSLIIRRRGGRWRRGSRRRSRGFWSIRRRSGC